MIALASGLADSKDEANYASALIGYEHSRDGASELAVAEALGLQLGAREFER